MTWVRGRVQSVDKRKTSDTSKVKTTYVTAIYTIAMNDDGLPVVKEAEIPLVSLKITDQTPPAVLAAAAANALASATAPVAAATVAAVHAASLPFPLQGTVRPNASPTRATATDPHDGATPAPPPPPPPPSTGASARSNSTGPQPVATANDGRHWYNGATDVEVGGCVPKKHWKMTDQDGSGRTFTPKCATEGSNLEPLDYFLASFPMKQLQQMVARTSAVLVENTLAPTSSGEVLKFLGINILITRFEFGSRATLWSSVQTSKYVPAVALGEKTGMPRDRFDHLWRFMVLERTTGGKA